MSDDSSRGENPYLISTTEEFGGKEFEVYVGHDGLSYWLNPDGKSEELERNPEFMILVLLGAVAERRKLANIVDEFTLSAPVPEADLIIIRDELAPIYWSEDTPDGFDERLDAILRPLFWAHVNPYLDPPLTEVDE